ncbi:MAG TPA: phosphoribosylanthranilate isomerase, partial [Planctomycetaceae bacterium]|nr:phosphoribosylanthranilate isomerase [Planctomycetaceae bacterium]
YRMGPAGLAPLEEYLHHCRSHSAAPHACVIDAHVSGSYGGTGQAVPWDRLHEEYRAEWPKLILAGGLNPENVARAIHVARPWGVDTASGVESAPGVKDFERVRQFIAAAREQAKSANE